MAGTEDKPRISDPEIMWGVRSPPESRWPAALGVAATLVIHTLMPRHLVVLPKWIYPALEVALLVPLLVYDQNREKGRTGWVRTASIAIIAVMTVVNVASVILLSHFVLTGQRIGGRPLTGRDLVLGAIEIWLINVVLFALWYWEIDRGGPEARTEEKRPRPDFLFPQMATPGIAEPEWVPDFLDYLYVSFTNTTAFSPTDTMPLTRMSKVLMGAQSLIALVTIVLVAARAVNIITG